MVNRMVQYLDVRSESAGRAFGALGDPVRLTIVERLGEGPASISELAEAAGMSLTGMKKHVSVLEEAGLVVTEKRGRTRWCDLATGGFDEAAFWLEEFRRRRHQQLNRLEEVIEKRKQERQK